MHSRAASSEQHACALFTARHERLSFSTQHEHRHFSFLICWSSCPYGPCDGRHVDAALLDHVAHRPGLLDAAPPRTVSCQPLGLSASAASRGQDWRSILSSDCRPVRNVDGSPLRSPFLVWSTRALEALASQAPGFSRGVVDGAFSWVMALEVSIGIAAAAAAAMRRSTSVPGT